MSTVIVTVGYKPADSVPGPVPSCPKTPREDPWEPIALVGGDITEGRHVVSSTWSPESIHALRAARSHATAQAWESHLLSAELLLAALPQLERQLVAVIRLSRSPHLRQAVPTVWQRLVPRCPWTAFVTTSWPRPAVIRLRRADRSVTLLPDREPDRDPVGLAIAAA